MTVIPMFPLGSVLFPAMPLALRVFEERYLKMMGAILENDRPVFGVVLIERGSEVGGGDKRFDVGTLAQVLQVEAPDGPLQVMARGTDRFRVLEWLEDDPYPQARVEMLPALELSLETEALLPPYEAKVREVLKELSTEQAGTWPEDIELAEDINERLWQLVGIAPLGVLDQQDLLDLGTSASLLDAADAVLTAAWETYRDSRNLWSNDSDGLAGDEDSGR